MDVVWLVQLWGICTLWRRCCSGGKTSSGLVIKSVSRSLSSVSRNTIHHIMQSKYAWGRVFRNATWKNVKGLINTTIKKCNDAD